uniref:G protein gamma domain-containing protein n=1 Tax=Strongyloides venezuelensis TaxID=75913 RepID=A0A0K0F6I0_STRVS
MESSNKTEISQTSNTVLGTEKNVKCKSKSTTQDNVINENTSSTDTSKDKLLTQEEMAKFLSEHIFNMQTSLSQQSGPIQLAKFDKNKEKDNEQSCIII